jgi:hypothetical protein
LAGLEAVHGDPDPALELFDRALLLIHHAGDVPNLAIALGRLAVLFDRIDRPQAAATLTGATTIRPVVTARVVTKLAAHLRALLGDTIFEQCVAAGAPMDPGDAVRFARDQIQAARHQLAEVD